MVARTLLIVTLHVHWLLSYHTMRFYIVTSTLYVALLKEME